MAVEKLESWQRWPVLAMCSEAITWLEIQSDVGLAPRTIEAYARGLADYFAVCQRDDVDPLTAERAEIARYVRDLTRRPSRRGVNVVALDSGVGLANATLQQRLVAVRLFYDHLIEEGHRETNPVGRGRYTPGKAFGGSRDRGLVPRFTKLPWIPSDEQWRTVLEAAKTESLRNRVMLALAYDAALRREELCSLRTDDLDPAYRTLRIRAETTKGRRERVVPYSAATGMLLRSYLEERRQLSTARGPLFLSTSRRNRAQPLTLWTWSKVCTSDWRAGRCCAIQHTYPPAFVPDRPGQSRLGVACDRHVCWPPQPGYNAPIYPPLGSRPCRQVGTRHGRGPCMARCPDRRPLDGASAMTGVAAHSTPDPARQVALKEPRWKWPVDVRRYDRAVELSAAERQALASLGDELRWWGWELHQHPAWSDLERLVQPLADARAALETRTKHARVSANAAVAAVIRYCALEDQPYWGWSSATWLRVLGADQPSYMAAHPRWVDRQARGYLLGIAYLLHCVGDLRVCGHYKRLTVAGHVFGLSRVQVVLRRVESVLERWGYSTKQHVTGRPIIRVVCELLLQNGSPRLADLNAAVFEELRVGVDPSTHAMLFQVQRALAGLGVLDLPELPPAPEVLLVGVPPNWSTWVQRWEATSTLAFSTRREARGVLLKIGRWLASEHPEGLEPENWTRELCAAYVAAVDRFRVGAYTGTQNAIHKRMGQPLTAATKQAYLCVARQFFRDGQEWGWFPRRFDPGRALATPRSIKAMIGPKPRVIDDAAWAKLLWAGLHLETADVPVSSGGRFYSVELIRALALTWLFGGLRSDEIARLRVGCVRWQRNEHASDANGDDVVCFLDVPVHKTGAPFTKPVDPLLGRAIAEWEKLRPEQPLLPDVRTGELVPLLFAVRAKRVSKTYLNLALIPALCRKAGVPEADARGRITSHRARSTIASQLYNAKEPMTLFELQAWLGHRSPQSTQYYARITPTTLAKAYSDAGYFGRNVRTIEVLLDRDVVQSGAVTTGTPWQYFDLGHGYCTFSFFEQCPHRMACARCDFYVPKASAKAQLLEAKENLARMLAEIQLTDDERTAVTDGGAAVEHLLERLADVPTPAGPTPRQMTTFVPIDDLTTGGG